MSPRRRYTLNNSEITVSWFEPNEKLWGGQSPKITLVFDEVTHYMLHMTLTYNRRAANPKMAFNADELRTKLREDLVAAQVSCDSLSVALRCIDGRRRPTSCVVLGRPIATRAHRLRHKSLCVCVCVCV